MFNPVRFCHTNISLPWQINLGFLNLEVGQYPCFSKALEADVTMILQGWSPHTGTPGKSNFHEKLGLETEVEVEVDPSFPAPQWCSASSCRFSLSRLPGLKGATFTAGPDSCPMVLLPSFGRTRTRANQNREHTHKKMSKLCIFFLFWPGVN